MYESANYSRYTHSTSTPATTSTSTLTLAQELYFLRSDFFKLVLKDPQGETDPLTDIYRGEAAGIESAFYVHKGLLASLSPELGKHVKNDMREGKEGQMQVSEVEEDTMIAFLCWAYRHDYQA